MKKSLICNDEAFGPISCQRVNMKIDKLALLLALLLPTSLAQANGWAFMSQHEQMKGFVIVDVGEAEKLSPPFNTTWNVDLYRLNGTCFSINGYYGSWGYGKKLPFCQLMKEIR